MQGKKLNMLVLIAIILITLVIGVAIGYLVFEFLENSKEVSEIEKVEEKLEEVKKEETKIENEQNTSISEISKYDGEKKIFVNQEISRISYNNKLIKKEDYDFNSKYMTTIFINDKEIKQIDTFGWGQYDEDEIEVSILKDSKKYTNEYILITINNTNPAVPVKEFIIVDNNGKILKELGWSGASGLYLLDNNVDNNKKIVLKTCIIESDKITLYYGVETSDDCNTTSMIEKTYKIVNGQVEEKVSDKITLKGLGYAGK